MGHISDCLKSTWPQKSWLVEILFLICFVGPIAAQQTEYYERGMRAMQLGLYDEAIADFQQVLQLNPQNAEATCQLGAVYRFKERNSAALATYHRALTLPASARTHGVAHLCLNRLYHSQGEFAAAERHGQHAIAMLPKNAEAFFRLADTYVQRGKLTLAERTYQKALALDANLAAIYHGLGKVAFLQSNLAEAATYYQQALALAPYHAETYYNLALVYRSLGRTAAGIAAKQHLTEAKDLMTSFQQMKTYNEETNRYRRVLLEKPTALEPRAKLAAAHIEMNNLKAAIGVYQTAITLHPDALPLYHNLGGLYMQTGQLTEAVATFQRLIRLDDTDAEAYLHLGWLSARLRKFTEAKTHLQTAIQKDRTLTPAYYGLAEVYVQHGQVPEAIALYQQLAAVTPRDAKPWVRLGVLQLKQQKTSEAIDAFTQAVAADQNSADAHNNLAWLYASQGEKLERAVELAERAVSLEATAARLDTLAYAYYRYGGYTEAEQAILRAIDLEPDNAAYKDRLDEIREAMERTNKR